MNLQQMEDELSLIIKDVSLQTYLKDWINNAILEIASEFDLPPLRIADPEPLGIDTSAWLWAMPDEFHKNLFRVKWQDSSDNWHHVHIHKDFTRLTGKDHTITDDHVSECAVVPQGDKLYLGVHPLSAQTLNLWYFRKPLYLDNGADVCDCIPSNFIRDTVYPKLVIQNYKIIVDQITDFDFKPLQFWQAELSRGLYGVPGQKVGLINFFNLRYNPPRQRGGRNPVGWRPYRYGSF